MGEQLRTRLRQSAFRSPYQEATLGLLVAAGYFEELMEETCERYGITSAQYNVLRILRGAHPDGHARCDIINRMIRRAPDVTRLIDRLVVSGHASRGKSKDDGRLSLTFITPKGLKLLDKMQPEIDAIDERLQAKLSERDARTLLRLCEAFIPDNDKEE